MRKKRKRMKKKKIMSREVRGLKNIEILLFDCLVKNLEPLSFPDPFSYYRGICAQGKIP